MDRPLAPNIDHGLPLAVFRSLVNSRLFAMDYEIVAEHQYDLTQFNGIQLGSIDICRHTGFGLHRSTRRPHHIRADKVDDYLIHLPLIGSTKISQGGISAGVEAGQFVVMTTTTPSVGIISAASGSDLFSCYQARISGSILRAHVPSIDHYCDQAIRIRRGSSSMLTPLFDLALHEGSYLPDNQTEQLGTVLIDVVVNSLTEAPELDARHGLSPRSTSQQIFERAKTYIESHLSDPELNIKIIAEQSYVSVRSLQSAFAESSITVTALILERRLLHCRAALRNPFLSNSTVTEIAVSWGFNSSAYFSQVYKRRFGITPSEDRAK